MFTLKANDLQPFLNSGFVILFFVLLTSSLWGQSFNFNAPVSYLTIDGSITQNDPNTKRNTDFAVEDMDNDGINDLIVVNNELQIFKGLGNGQFTGQTFFNISGGPSGPNSIDAKLTIADLNNDGFKDIVGPGVYLGNEGGDPNNLKNVEVSIISLSKNIILSSDFNNDDIADVLSDQKLFLGVGDGTFTESIVNISIPNAIEAISIDINNDGNMDVLLVEAIGSSTINESTTPSLTAYIGDGNGSFSSTIGYNVAAQDFVIHDFNEDSNPDIAYTSLSESYVSILFLDATGNIISESNRLNLSVDGSSGKNGPANISIANFDDSPDLRNYSEYPWLSKFICY